VPIQSSGEQSWSQGALPSLQGNCAERKGKNVEIFMEAENEIWQKSGEGCDYVSGWMPELENERFRLSTLQGRKSVASLAVIFWECDEISLPGDITTSRREFAV